MTRFSLIHNNPVDVVIVPPFLSTVMDAKYSYLLVYPLASLMSAGLSFCLGILNGPLLGSLALIFRMAFKACFSSGHWILSGSPCTSLSNSSVTYKAYVKKIDRISYNNCQNSHFFTIQVKPNDHWNALIKTWIAWIPVCTWCNLVTRVSLPPTKRDPGN